MSATVHHEICRASAPGSYTLTAYADCPPGRMDPSSLPLSGSWTGTFWNPMAKMFVAAHGTWKHTAAWNAETHVEVELDPSCETMPPSRQHGIAVLIGACLHEIEVLGSNYDPS